MFKTLWSCRLASQLETKRTLDTERSTIELQVEQFLDRIADTDMPSIVAAYEKRIREKNGKSFSRNGSQISAVRCPTSTTHLKLRSTSCETS